jgi:hypothetical protein
VLSLILLDVFHLRFIVEQIDKQYASQQVILLVFLNFVGMCLVQIMKILVQTQALVEQILMVEQIVVRAASSQMDLGTNSAV